VGEATIIYTDVDVEGTTVIPEKIVKVGIVEVPYVYAPIIVDVAVSVLVM